MMEPAAEVPVSSVVDYFLSHAKARPGRAAVVDDLGTASYAEVERLSAALACTLLHTVGPDPQIIGLAADRNRWLPVAIIGIMRAGHAYVPLDPCYPESRLRFISSDADVQCAVATEDGGLTLRTGGRDVRVSTASPAADYPAVSAFSGHRAAYVIYTSGSTGTPKGVVVTHKNLRWLVESAASVFELTSDDMWTCVHSYNFDFSVWEMWCPLVRGATLRVVGRETATDPVALLDLMARDGVTVYNAVPSAFRYVAKAAARRGLPPSVREVILGGEVLDLDAVGRWYSVQRQQACRVSTAYGVTEATVMSTYRHLEQGDEQHPAVARNIGRPLPGVSIRLDSDRATGAAPAELIIGGPGVAAGYLNWPSSTEARFLTNHAAKNGGEREYKTGDLVYVSESGELEFAGRADHQLKHNGYRIEPGEIEAALLSNPQAGAVCVVLCGNRGGKQLAAFYTGAAGADDLQRTVRQAGLPAHMQPVRYERLNVMPTTPNGKVDRGALENA